MPIQRLGGAGDDNLGTKVATHEVERYSDHASLILLFAEGEISAKIPVLASLTTELCQMPEGLQSFFQSLRAAKAEGFLSSSPLSSTWPENSIPCLRG